MMVMLIRGTCSVYLPPDAPEVRAPYKRRRYKVYLVLTRGTEQVPLISMTLIAILAQHPHPRPPVRPTPTAAICDDHDHHWPPVSGDLLWINALDHLPMYFREIEWYKHPGPRPPESNVNNFFSLHT